MLIKAKGNTGSVFKQILFWVLYTVLYACASAVQPSALASVQNRKEIITLLFFVPGFEKMEGGLSERYTDRISPVSRHMDHMVAMGADPALIQPRMNRMTSDVIKLFAYAAREYMELYPQVSNHFQEMSSLAWLQYYINRLLSERLLHTHNKI